MKAKEKRYSNSYKCTTKAYNKAMRRAKKEKVFLANILEEAVGRYGNGYQLTAIKPTVEGAKEIVYITE